ncbi:hypothetical protein P153DRAFT_2229 [Dothidotthia symphoricarpi CBS 119687]|uniref:SH3 domain-containing protein n=1 Tax=Dothidotthia symphoricarpi CBS 119687 TaxID=1392245 RepID=A0A6A6AR51_9PLEO|nr:uncharacterized protein P153DRAFT_2229 [Dothidotthia symphoricarpi CBS 119687]KAF2134462.1 hypothetical protein P153DRAFT_2229 [Dothidotthia symphoricarpi CBS 119687]
MGHPHAHAHLVQRQRNRDEEEDNGAVATVISVQIVTMPNTYTGKVVWVTQSDEVPKTLLAPATRERETSTADEDQPEATTRRTANTKSTVTSKRPSSTARSEAEETKMTKAVSTLVVATKSPTVHPASTVVGLVSVTASATISSTPTAEASAGGMSGGAKAGLALGILFGVGALLVGILFLYGRKKKQMAGDKNNEKTGVHNAPPPPPQAGAVPSSQTQRNLTTAPRLSLRPLTGFSSTWSDNRKSGGNLLAVAAAAPEPGRPTSAWERPGATNATTAPATPVAPVNPFNDAQALPNSPPNNPFTNDAAVDAAQVSTPGSPLNTPLLRSTAPSANLANPAPVIATANVNATPTPLPTNIFPAPPSIKSIADAVPPSPAWTEDVPASPGPAPGGMPAVVAVAGVRPNGPPAGPNNVHRVQLDFNPSMADELGLRAGSLVRMLHEYDDGWALCINMDRSQQGVVPRTCLSKHPVKPRTGPPPQGPPQGMRGPVMRPAMSPSGILPPQPLSPANGRMSPAPRSMSPGPKQMSPPQVQGSPRARSNSNAHFSGPPPSMSPGPRQMSPRMQEPPRGRSNSNAPYAGPPRSMSPGPYGGGPHMAPPPQMGRPRSNSASQVIARRGPATGPSPMNPNPAGASVPRKPVPGMAM